jgi:putative oxidoreductase
MRDEVFLLGRILLALVFLLNGIGHLTKTEPSAQYATYKKVPNAREAVLLSGALMILGAIALILGIWMDLAALGLAILVVIMAFVMHRFWEEADAQTKAVEQAHFFKNIAIAGGCLLLVAVVGDGFEPPYSITDGVF